jgi:hypothetical protein
MTLTLKEMLERCQERRKEQLQNNPKFEEIIQKIKEWAAKKPNPPRNGEYKRP